MSQSFIAGMTNYEEQSITDIKNDIIVWIKYSNEIKAHFIKTILDLKTTGYWTKVPFGFASFCESIPKICETFCHDFEIIVKAIDEDNISKREILLMQNIYKCARENEEFSWRTFKDKNDEYWHEYGNKEFQKVESLYADGRDFFVTLKDVSNAVARMEDYMKTESKVINNIEDKSIHIEGSNKIKNTSIGNTITAGVEQEGFLKKSMWKIIPGIVVGVLVAVICAWLGLK